MRNITFAVLLMIVATLHFGCASVRSVSYGDGWVKSSTVSYSFAAPPILEEMAGRSYLVKVTGAESAEPVTIAAFDKKGMKSTSQGRVDVQVSLELGEVRQKKPGAMKVGSKWYPAFEVSVPYKITMHKRDGSSLTGSSGTYSNALTFRQMQGFASREEAVEAIDAIRKLAKSGIDEKAMKSAVAEARQSANKLASGLLAKRNIALDVPVVRAAAGLDLEESYRLLARAKGPEEVQAALDSYEAVGTQHVKEDGSPNNTANYGVACGIAASKLMLRDLPGAWRACEVASTFERRGEEADQVRRVIYEQERVTGLKVIPDEERKVIDAQMNMANALEEAFGSLGD